MFLSLEHSYFGYCFGFRALDFGFPTEKNRVFIQTLVSRLTISPLDYSTVSKKIFGALQFIVHVVDDLFQNGVRDM